MVEVPTNYWGGFSFNYARQRRSSTLLKLLYPYRYGTQQDQGQAMAANRCELTLPPESTVPSNVASFVDRDGEIRRHILLHHRFALGKLDENGRYSHNFYPHHIWSSFWEYPEFADLDLRTVVAYRFVGQAICMRWQDMHFTTQVLREISFDIPVE